MSVVPYDFQTGKVEEGTEHSVRVDGTRKLTAERLARVASIQMQLAKSHDDLIALIEEEESGTGVRVRALEKLADHVSKGIDEMERLYS